MAAEGFRIQGRLEEMTAVRHSGRKGRPEEMAAGDSGREGVRRKMAAGDSGREGVRRKMAAEEYETYGDLHMMKINGDRNGTMGGDIGTLDETMNNKREWVWGCL